MCFGSHTRAQTIMIELLQQFDEYCTKHQLAYTMVWGTLLGAVRHQGFIPWDDDVDLAMPRSDYERFLSLTEREPIHQNISIVNWKNDNNFSYSISRVVHHDHKVEVPYLRHQPSHMSPWLDIFPFDPVKSADIQRGDLPSMLRIAHAVQGPMIYSYPLTSPAHFIKHMLGAGLRYIRRPLLSYIDSAARLYTCKSPQQYACLVERAGKLICINHQSFYEPIRMKFEGLMLPAMPHYHEWLTSYYGNYLQLPPLDQRVGHQFTFTNTERM